MAGEFRCTRSISIAAPVEQIIPLVVDLHAHVGWSPFSKPDPKTTDAYSGAPGVGQSRTFEGGKFGAGSVRIEAVESHRVQMRLDMRKPMKVSNVIEYVFTPEPEGTNVSWTLTGPMTLLSRIMGLFMDCDAMCGRFLEQGLAGLKAEAERAHATV